MSIQPIPPHPYKPLRQQAEQIDHEELLSDDFHTIVQSLIETLLHEGDRGAGLAANQIGITKQVFVTNMDLPNGTSITQVFINPEIISVSSETEIDWEGCLSFPDQWGQVERPTFATVRAQNLKGEVFTVQAKDFYARLLQHEYDHLQGVLFIDKLESDLISTEALRDIARQEHEDPDEAVQAG